MGGNEVVFVTRLCGALSCDLIDCRMWSFVKDCTTIATYVVCLICRVSILCLHAQ